MFSRRYSSVVFILFFLTALNTALYSNENRVFEITETMQGIDLAEYIDFRIDTVNGEEVSDYRSFHENSFGYSENIYTARLKLQNSADEKRTVYIEQNYALVDRINLRKGSLDSEPVVQTGDKRPFHNRDLHYRNPVFKITLAAGATETVFFSFNSEGSLIIDLLAWDRDSLFHEIKTENLILGLYYGMMIVMVLYNFFLYTAIRTRVYLYYVIYISIIIVFQLNINGLSFQYLWPEAVNFTNISLPMLVFAGFFGVYYFTLSFLELEKNLPAFYRIFQVLMVTAVIGVIGTLTVFNYSVALRYALLEAFLSVGVLVVASIIRIRQGYRPAVYFLTAWAVFLTGILLYAMKSWGLIPAGFVSKWAIQIGSVVEVVLLSLALADRINVLRLNLESKVKDLNRLNLKVDKSEKIYRNLVENSQDMIFSLSKTGHFLTVNKAVKVYLGYQPEELTGKHFLELMFLPHAERTKFAREYLGDKLKQALTAEAKRVDFRGEFANRNSNEPVTLDITLEPVEVDHEVEIIGKAVHPVEDVMTRYFVRESQVYEVDNFIQNADLLSERLTSNLQLFLSSDKIIEIRICLREMIINAIEHGNLGISYEEKNEALERGDYMDILSERQLDRDYRDRTVKIDYHLDEKRAVYIIEDSGQGFDHEKVMREVEQANDEFRMHGRGISLTVQVFDEMIFNQKGNSVKLVFNIDQ